MSRRTCFKGVTLRTGVKYQNLHNHVFTYNEKLWLCENIVEAGKNGFRTYVRRYNLRRGPLKVWLRGFRNETLMDGETGITVKELRVYQKMLGDC